MNLISKIKAFVFYDTYGSIATVMFLICVISGIVLAIPYNVSSPLESLSLLMIANPAAVFFRNIHYWSAQFFLIFTFLHLWEHLKLNSEMTQKHGIWFRLSISVLVVLFAMITGFILKADADSLQARRIITTLVSEFPVFGKTVSYGLFGKENNFQLIYVNHIATATIFLAIIIWEHAKTLWPTLKTFILTLAILSVFGLMLNAPLHNAVNSVVKGPWYFVGLQEILHWTSIPVIALFGILMLTGLIYMLFFIPEKNKLFAKKGLLWIFYAYMILTFIGFFFRGENWTWKWPREYSEKLAFTEPFMAGIHFSDVKFSEYSEKDIPVIGNHREACMVCHKGVTGFSKAHDPEAIGCASCHLGNPFTLNKKMAHRTMVLIPGNLIIAKQTCGTTDCHPDIVDRIGKTLMTTNSGIVSVDRFVFGETNSPDIHSDIETIGHTAADEHLRDLCANCHLGKEKTETGAVDQLSRGGGCTACHLNYSDRAKEMHNRYIAGSKNDSLLPKVHPSLDLNASNDHCFGCHSRSGRISTNYEGWHETMLEEKDVKGKDGYRVLQDKRVFEFVSDDIHHQKGIDCIDCHNSYETMGDGKVYLHEENQVKTKCEDCHLVNEPELISYDSLDAESKKIVDILKLFSDDKNMIRGANSKVSLINTYVDSGKVMMVGKISKKKFEVKPPAPICMRNKVHKSLTCSSCHTSWAPQCIGCHNQFDSRVEGLDLLSNKMVKGQWIEYVGKFFAEPPTLGVREGKEKKIEPGIPGMILTINKDSYTISSQQSNPDSANQNIIFHRLYAPTSPHTTSAKGRSCKSCHNDPLAIGYGRGTLTYTVSDKKGNWNFVPEYAPNKYDGLPEDAWIEFPFNSSGTLKSSDEYSGSTRTDFRPFTIEEQKKILTVGACLTCHEENSAVMQKSLNFEFKEYVKKISEKCVLPVY